MSSFGEPAIHSWQQDFLGNNFQRLNIELGADPDGETDIYATLIRYYPEDSEDSEYYQRPALLWVHGMTDYFFHTEFAEYCHSRGFAVYALDLRKCGRSYRPGQTWHHTSDLSFYFADLNAALDIISADHSQVVPVAHSTGGLIVALWLNQLRTTDPHRHVRINALILNSPWLDMMYPRALVRLARPAIKYFGAKYPLWVLPNDGLGPYGRSIHKDFYGEWEFDTNFKPVTGHPKNLGWLRAIIAGQESVHDGEVNVGVNTLTLCSEKSWFNREYSEQTNTADAVLDVKHIQRWAPHLASDPSQVTVLPISDARHDVFLSQKPVRTQAAEIMSDWLDQQLEL